MSILRASVLFAYVAAGAPLAAATSVAANLAAPTSLGSFTAGTYTISTTGLVDLAGGPVPGTFTVRPDGTPDTVITSGGYGYCNPSGCDFDVFSNAFGVGGAGRNLGALLGTLTATPTSPSDYFLIGFGTTVTLAVDGTLYAQVNDTFYPNNVGAFSVEVTAIPEPGTWALMIGGFIMVGTAARRRHRAFVTA